MKFNYTQKSPHVEAFQWNKKGDDIGHDTKVYNLPFIRYFKYGIALGRLTNFIPPQRMGYVDGQDVYPGNWVVRNVYGHIKVMSDTQFKFEYKEL
jgi:hypothetical protein